MLLTSDDFVNKYELSVGMYSDNKLDAYIQKYEERYLVHLLGSKLYQDFIDDLDANVPKSPNFKKIFDPFNIDLDSLGSGILYGNRNGIYLGSNSILESEGILEMLKGFIYFEYSKDLMNQQTPYGNVKQRSENSVVVDSPHSLIYSRYNEAIQTYRAIQQYIYREHLPLGQIVSYTLVGGSGYSDGTFNLIGGSGSGGSVTITTIGGVVDSLSLANVGTKYSIGDVLTIDAGNNDATLTLTYVGIGDWDEWNGIMKGTAYWI